MHGTKIKKKSLICLSTSPEGRRKVDKYSAD